MKRQSFLAFSAVSLILISGVALGATKKWNQKMQELSKVLESVIPEVLSNKPGVSKGFEKNVKKLSELSHTISTSPTNTKAVLPPDADPSLAMLSDLFNRETKRAYVALRNGSPEYAKLILRSATTYCISCHTRSDSGPDFPLISMPKTAEKLGPYEKAQWFAATRQFDSSLGEFTKVLSDASFASKRQIEWQRAAKQSLAIAVRMKRDPERAIALVDSASKSSGMPQFFREQLRGWKNSLVAWKEEPAKTLKTEDDFYGELKRLITLAQQTQKYPADHSADVIFLRASAAGHDLLSKNPDGKYAPEALLWMGTSYEVLGEQVLWPLHEMYFETCIRKAPHTPIATDCFNKYESAIYFGYSGSGGVNIPSDAQALLTELRELSTTKEEKGAAPAAEKKS